MVAILLFFVCIHIILTCLVLGLKKKSKDFLTPNNVSEDNLNVLHLKNLNIAIHETRNVSDKNQCFSASKVITLLK